jgi:hypothetical protein
MQIIPPAARFAPNRRYSQAHRGLESAPILRASPWQAAAVRPAFGDELAGRNTLWATTTVLLGWEPTQSVQYLLDHKHNTTARASQLNDKPDYHVPRMPPRGVGDQKSDSCPGDARKRLGASFLTFCKIPFAGSARLARPGLLPCDSSVSFAEITSRIFSINPNVSVVENDCRFPR